MLAAVFSSGRRGSASLGLLALLLLFLGMTGCNQAVEPTPQPPRPKPNIVWIMADDLGYGEVGCYGQEKIATKHIDQMAAEGMRFTQAYSAGTICIPARCSLMTGLHTGHSAMRSNKPEPFRPWDKTVAQSLKESGYTTAIIGKWALGGAASENGPTARGFDYFYGIDSQFLAHNYYPDFVWRNQDKVPIPGNVLEKPNVAKEKSHYMPDLVTAEALAFIDKNKERPFFLYLPYSLPHINNEQTGAAQHEVPSLGPYADKPWSEEAKGHAAMISYLDEQVGKILAHLRQLKLDKSTLVVFTGDNGPLAVGGIDPEFFNASGGLRGVKRDLYEGGIRVPMISWWPGTIKAGSESDHVWAFWDFFPTAMELAGAQSPPHLDGVSIAPTLTGKGGQKQSAGLYWEFHENGLTRAARVGKWKAVARHGAQLELYDLEKDPAEARDLAKEFPDEAERMNRFMQESQTPVDQRHFQVDGAQAE